MILTTNNVEARKKIKTYRSLWEVPSLLIEKGYQAIINHSQDRDFLIEFNSSMYNDFRILKIIQNDINNK